jgi:hypothetical protein
VTAQSLMINSVLEGPGTSMFKVGKGSRFSEASRRLQWTFCHQEILKFNFISPYIVLYYSMDFLISVHLTGVLLYITRCVITECVVIQHFVGIEQFMKVLYIVLGFLYLF